MDFGCITKGKPYDGSASQTKYGEKCLPWNTPGLAQLFVDQGSWNHNYCRNGDGGGEGDDIPICYIDESNYEECEIPLCESTFSPRCTRPDNSELIFTEPKCNAIRYKLEDECQVEFNKIYTEAYEAGENNCGLHPNPTTQYQNICSMDQFQCQPGECIYNKYICDGENDCSNGLDETNCVDYASFYAIDHGFKLLSDDKSITNVTVDECAKLCTQYKRSECDSFSYNSNKSRCILGNKSLKAFDSLLGRKAWNYYRYEDPVKRQTHNFIIESLTLKKQRGIDIVNVKVNGQWGGVCEDAVGLSEADVICKQMGFEQGAETVFKGQMTDTNDPILLFDMKCNGDENHISECKFEDHAEHHHVCQEIQKAGIKCKRQRTRFPSTQKQVPTSQPLSTCHQEHDFQCRNGAECIDINHV